MANGNWSSAKLNGSTVTELSLFSSVLSSDGITIWHLIAYRRATWIPAANRGVWNSYTGDIDDDSIIAALRADPPTDLPPEWFLDRTLKVEQGDTLAQESLAISLNEGVDTSKRVIIRAEGLIIYAGSVFGFPGKEVTILARRIIIVPSQPGWLASSDPKIASVVINTVTPPGSIPTKPEKAGNGKDAYWVHNQVGADAQDGKPGVNGTAGPMGVDGGSVLLCAQVQSLGFSGSTGPTLSLLCDARQGCNGGGGGDDGNGGNGYSSDDKFYDYHGDVSMCNGGNGGVAGNGGNAGFGGKLTLPSSLIAFGLVDTSHSVSKGADGKWGSPGTQGAGGSAGYVYVSEVESSIRKVGGTAGKDGKDKTDFIRPIIPIPIVNNNVSKPEFQTQYKAVQEGLNGAGTATAIGAENIDSSQLLLQAVLVQKQQFEAMVSTYYPSGAPTDVQIAWDNLLEIAEKL
ncbi:uncharacterized protein FMAN_15393 [Fusarium mangiferae]|uniref:Uncharacterized protein n=1 Tax=Fusarium mangiferae TaxID=192010 RepID=A0A1L7UH23_FUSMA|nr:uncharacterized protein FMAN_15393 [Fusarium mangiferae]CVL07325.1 uncharacterized protein FMAN_15393 [Fusarium mangiferae]